MGKGQIHYIEVATDNDEEEQGSHAHDNVSTSSEKDTSHEEEEPPRRPSTPVGVQSLVEPQPHEKAKR
jgi:hypothetical protein